MQNCHTLADQYKCFRFVLLCRAKSKPCQNPQLCGGVDQALDKAIAAVRPGMRYRDVGDIISTHVSSNGFQVVKAYCGHGIGDLFHCAPNIPHYGRNKVPSIVLLFPVSASHHVPAIFVLHL